MKKLERSELKVLMGGKIAPDIDDGAGCKSCKKVVNNITLLYSCTKHTGTAGGVSITWCTCNEPTAGGCGYSS